MKRLLVLLTALLIARIAVGQVIHNQSAQAAGLPFPALLTSTTVAPELASPGFTFRASVREVRINIAVADAKGTPVTQLTPSDIEVFDSGKPVTQFNAFESRDTLPLKIVFLFDASESTEKMLPALKAVAPAFLGSIFKPGTDMAMLASFSTKINRLHSFTGNVNQLANSFDQIHSQGLTALYDTLVKVSEQDLSSESSQPERRVIILFSDGIDNYSINAINEATLALNRRGIILYSVFLNSRKAPVAGIDSLERLSEATGGRAFLPTKPEQIAPAFAAIEQDLRTQFFLTFSPASRADGNYHRISVRLKAGKKWTIRTRDGYVADQAQDEDAAPLVASR
jgi:VWFA-related protein